jgi:hypothetical protein
MIENPVPDNWFSKLLCPERVPHYRQKLRCCPLQLLGTETYLPNFITMDEMACHWDFWIIPGGFVKNKNESLSFIGRRLCV